MGALIDEVPVDLDTGKRIGKSKMPVAKTMAAYWRMLARHAFSSKPEVVGSEAEAA
jgi:hypothetical protein